MLNPKSVRQSRKDITAYMNGTDPTEVSADDSGTDEVTARVGVPLRSHNEIFMGSRLVDSEHQTSEREARFSQIEGELQKFMLAIAERFESMEQRVAKNETSSQASMTEIEKIEDYLQQAEESRQHEMEVYRGKKESLGKELDNIESYLEDRQRQDEMYKAELEQEVHRLKAMNQAQQEEILRLKQVAWSEPVGASKQPYKVIPPPIITRKEINEKEDNARPDTTTKRIAGGDVVMRDALEFL
ncbi:hypothetical protein BCR32DRAFT_287782 [Anaeromyces robustus]|uniref:Uncharacterized protein n=1 Tax=Anaeromyces robustus TaxID=1754192 RepID=A0A1Y1VQ71_9FUNG|nr:hypothetical protein BCR32DRAFT_287782 [Anaeromyces robustus]|eukprot:ORX63409.1 hypothetical protein BCR32DRAFT_287782 [Anaeromyces robustus]